MLPWGNVIQSLIRHKVIERNPVSSIGNKGQRVDNVFFLKSRFRYRSRSSRTGSTWEIGERGTADGK
jgi:hypothetical protein